MDETALSYSEIKALATGNPLIIEKCNLDVEVSKLNMLKANHLNQRFSLENMVYRRYPAKIAELKEQIAGYEKDVATAQAHPKSTENFVGMEIYGTYHSEKEAAGRAIINACTDLQGSKPVQLGQYRGFSLSLQYDAAHTDYKLTIKGAMSHTISLGTDIYGNITRMDNVVDGLGKELEACWIALTLRICLHLHQPSFSNEEKFFRKCWSICFTDLQIPAKSQSCTKDTECWLWMVQICNSPQTLTIHYPTSRA